MKIYFLKINIFLAYFFIALGSILPTYSGIFNIFNDSQINKEYLVLENNVVRIKIVTGKGKTKKEAKKNAAKNALLELSPRYVKERYVDRSREVLIDGEFDESKTINTLRHSNYGYNQGILVSLDVLNYSFKNGIFTVDAMAKVIQNTRDINDPFFNPPSSSNSKDLGLRKVFIVGTGHTEEAAANDAMAQALMEVIADNINLNKNSYSSEELKYLITKAKEISSFTSKEIIDDMRSSYTEGFIESFKKLNSYEIGAGLINVEAEIIVRRKSFSSYLDEIDSDLKDY